MSTTSDDIELNEASADSEVAVAAEAAVTSAPRRLDSTRDLMLIALIAALIIVSRSLLRIPMRIPGHSGLFWIALLVIGKGVVRRPTGGTLIGLITGVLAVALIPGREGLFTALKYIAPGVALDLLTPLLGGDLRRPVVGALAGGVAHMAKLLTSLLVGLALHIPAGFLVLGIGFAATTHVVFGVAGGLIGSLVLQRLDRAGVLDRRGRAQ